MDWKAIVTQAQRRNRLTQSELASAVGCSQAYISALVHGHRREPNYSLGSRLVALATQSRHDHRDRDVVAKEA